MDGACAAIIFTLQCVYCLKLFFVGIYNCILGIMLKAYLKDVKPIEIEWNFHSMQEWREEKEAL